MSFKNGQDLGSKQVEKAIKNGKSQQPESANNPDKSADFGVQLPQQVQQEEPPRLI